MLPSGALLVRAYFGDESAWQSLKSEVETPSPDGFLARVRFVDDHAYEGMTAGELIAATPQGPGGALVSFLADQRTLTDEEHPILAVWVFAGRAEGPSFRVVPAALWGVENNLNLSNMDWRDFAGSVDGQGIHRGF